LKEKSQKHRKHIQENNSRKIPKSWERDTHPGAGDP
jgi:hypothetical protein